MTEQISHDLLGAIGGVPKPPTETVVQATDVQKWFGKLNVLKGVSLEVKRQETVVIAGPSGSGKTTILNMIGCVDRPTSGRVIINGSATKERRKNTTTMTGKKPPVYSTQAGWRNAFKRNNSRSFARAASSRCATTRSSCANSSCTTTERGACAASRIRFGQYKPDDLCRS